MKSAANKNKQKKTITPDIKPLSQQNETNVVSELSKTKLIFALFFIICFSKSCENMENDKKKQISSSVWSVQHPNAGQNNQQPSHEKKIQD